MRISVRGHNFALVGERTMGKVSWPAGHALADWILERGDAAGDAPPEATLVEVGAGCGLPALAAAALGRAAGWSCVAATDFVEHAVELLRENVVRNAAQIHVARLDAVEGGVAALSAVIDEAETAAAAAPPPRELWIVAADIHYHEAVVAALLAAAAGVARAWPSRCVRVVLARSSNFEHCDAAVERAAAECGLRLVRRHVRRAAGVLDAIGLDGGAAYVGCDDDVSDLFEYEVEMVEAAVLRVPLTRRPCVARARGPMPVGRPSEHREQRALGAARGPAATTAVPVSVGESDRAGWPCCRLPWSHNMGGGDYDKNVYNYRGRATEPNYVYSQRV